MTTSDQHGQGPLTRKQLREIRLTGSTPVITDEEAAAAPAQTREPDAVVEKPAVEKPAAQKPASQKPAAKKPAAEKPAPVAEAPVAAKPAPVAEEAAAPASAAAPLTRRQARDQERVRTASVPVVEPEDATPLAPVEPPAPAAQEPAPQEQPPADRTPIVSAVPEFSAPAAPAVSTDDDIDEDDAEVAITPVSAAGASASVGEMPLDAAAEEPQEDVDDVDAVLGLDQEPALSDTDDVLADVGDDDEVIAPDERPTVNPAFGASVIDKTQKPFAPSFDELLTVGDSSGSQHTSPSALIFTPSPGEGSLSGPVASTGEILVTGSYELPRGIGSQGHAHGVADGKDVDAVLIDGELPPASSPTPIAASSAVSTIKPAGEVIRPPAPEKGNKLMLILAIVAGGLALALGVVLVVAFTTNVF
ncbi:hypothetical protein [Microbacterium galbinum]|uniref:hypothetical protein n=1 Tax=Microbacterium galbinum TaxID=2851646 RepID=UPI001FFC8599|nr:hypothetical protein [Microbacterium galbinum]MCK2028255.1 hypothetical protein [Microbacterium galbinum]